MLCDPWRGVDGRGGGLKSLKALLLKVDGRTDGRGRSFAAKRREANADARAGNMGDFMRSILRHPIRWESNPSKGLCIGAAVPA